MSQEELVDKVALALWLHHRGVERAEFWPTIPEKHREWFREFSRVAIAAVKEALP